MRVNRWRRPHSFFGQRVFVIRLGNRIQSGRFGKPDVRRVKCRIELCGALERFNVRRPNGGRKNARSSELRLTRIPKTEDKRSWASFAISRALPSLKAPMANFPFGPNSEWRTAPSAIR